MTARRDQDGGGGSSVPREYTDLAERVAMHLSSYSFDPATRARHLHHLRELAATQPLPRPAHGHVGFRWRVVVRRVAGTAAASLAAITLGGTVVGAAAQNALPGDRLYGTKRFVERVERAAALTPEGNVAVRLNHADRRLDETEKLLQQDVMEEQLIVSTLTEMQQDIRDAERMAGDDERLREQVAQSATAASERLEPIAQAPLPEPARKSADAALATAQEAASTGPSGVPEQEPTVPAGGPGPLEPRPAGPQIPELPPDLKMPQLPSGPERGAREPAPTTTEPTPTPTSKPSPGGPDNRGARPGVDRANPDVNGANPEPGTNSRTGAGYPTSYPTSYPTPRYPSLPTSYRWPPSEAAQPAEAAETGETGSELTP